MENIKWMTDIAILKRIGEQIKNWRLEMNLSPARLAEKADLGLSTVSGVESGNGTSLQNLIKILRILDRLDSLYQFFQDKNWTPLEFQKIESGITPRKRASKSNKNDSNDNSTPLW
ncbi:MAG: helix-turn-helix transcriptional regulator [Bacteroidales bacterium]|nr:helix-turn-helix transcriptional regulator [Bacteroidales bacterium]